jgi:hypothetical protein
VQNGGEEVVATGGDAGAVGAVGCGGQGFAKFAIFPRGGVDEPAEVVAVVVEQQGTGVGFAVSSKAGELGFGELTGGEVGNGDVEVKWSGAP